MITKRQLGLIFVALGVAAVIGVLAIELLGVGRHPGIGPTQRIALLVAGLVLAVGLSLVPLGDRPA
jgi:hypothetical protein